MQKRAQNREKTTSGDYSTTASLKYSKRYAIMTYLTEVQPTQNRTDLEQYFTDRAEISKSAESYLLFSSTSGRSGWISSPLLELMWQRMNSCNLSSMRSKVLESNCRPCRSLCQWTSVLSKSVKNRKITCQVQ